MTWRRTSSCSNGTIIRPTSSTSSDNFLDQEAFTDVTLAAEGRTFLAHKLVLSACSPYLREILERNPCKHPVVFLRGVAACELHTLLQYIYKGEAHVTQERLPDLLRTATDLQIKGLATVTAGEPRPAGDQELNPYPSPPLSTPSKGPTLATLPARGLIGLPPTALNLNHPPGPTVLDSLRLPLLNKLGTTAVERQTSAGVPLQAPPTAGDDDQSDDGTMPLVMAIKTEDEGVAPGSVNVIVNDPSELVETRSALDGPPELPRPGGGIDNTHIQGLIAQLASPRQPSGGVRKGPYTCRFCGETFKAKEHLNRHERIHTGERPFPCVLCGKRFSRKDHLKIHVLIHTGEKPYSCTMCNKRFTQKQTLIEHENVHLGRKPFRCDLCDASFPARGNLKYHKRSIHGCAMNSTVPGTPSKSSPTPEPPPAAPDPVLNSTPSEQGVSAV